MKELITTDNNCGFIVDDPEKIEDLLHISNCSLDSLRDLSGHDLWLFPPKGDRYDDKIDNDPIFTISGNTLTTSNIMGFVGYGQTELTIQSRFTKPGKKDWFMQYMLQKVFSINVFDLKHAAGSDNSLDIAALIFPYFLQKALHQGLYREYTKRQYNDSRVKGVVNVNRHIQENFPFKNGKIAYSAREYTYDNSITQLIRHTIEHIKSKNESASELLFSSSTNQSNVKQILEATPTYRKSDLRKVLLSNLKPKIHPYYSEYRPLQRLCMQILRDEKLSYDNSGDRIHGILFDGAWLWEEYLSITFKKAGYEHPENKKGKRGNPIYPFINRTKYTRFPDFMKDEIIADAKYKNLYRNSRDVIYDDLSRDDLNQMITYLHITKAHTGIFVGPMNFRVFDGYSGEELPETDYCTRVGYLAGAGGEIFIIAVNIPQECSSYSEFCDQMTKNENILLKDILKADAGELTVHRTFDE